MKQRALSVVAGALSWTAALMFAPGSSAHHSLSPYDLTSTKVVAGTVKEFQWTNPHSWIQLMVADASGQLVEWSIEVGTPNFNMRHGWKKSDIRPGDTVTARVHPMRDGSPHGTLVDVTLRDGRVLKGHVAVIQGSAAATE